MEVLQFDMRSTRQNLSVPQITEVLWRIASESRPDPAMADFVDYILAAIEELMELRAVAHAAMLESDRERMAAAMVLGQNIRPEREGSSQVV